MPPVPIRTPGPAQPLMIWVNFVVLGDDRGGGGQCHALLFYAPQRDVVAERDRRAARIGTNASW
jgi:hypothetical protein